MKTWAHIAFQVDDVEAEVAKYDASKIFAKPYVPFEGVKVAFIDHEGMLIEFLQIVKK
jgi:diaminopimelate epimerase